MIQTTWYKNSDLVRVRATRHLLLTRIIIVNNIILLLLLSLKTRVVG